MSLLITANGVCLHLLVSPLAQCCLISGRTFEKKAFFATTSFKKGGWAYFRGLLFFEGGAILRDYGTYLSSQ